LAPVFLIMGIAKIVTKVFLFYDFSRWVKRPSSFFFHETFFLFAQMTLFLADQPASLSVHGQETPGSPFLLLSRYFFLRVNFHLPMSLLQFFSFFFEQPPTPPSPTNRLLPFFSRSPQKSQSLCWLLHRRSRLFTGLDMDSSPFSLEGF